MYEHDVLVIGGGGAGLRAAVAAHEAGADVAIVSKVHPVRSHTGAAEGGVNAALHEDDPWEDHAYDTMKGSDFLADAPAVDIFAREIREEVIQLEHWGMPFSRDDDGTVSQRPFGGLSFPRTAYAGAETGHHMLHAMYQQVVKRGIDIYEEWYVTRLAVTDHDEVADRQCHGFAAFDIATGEVAGFRARDGVVLATGGAGQVFKHTTNAIANTGDGAAMAYRAGVPLEDMEMIQFHPTTLPSTGVLITEGVRGEGGRLFNSDGERFMFERGYAVEDGELASRDVVSRAELTEVAEGRGVDDDHVYLDMRHLGEERIMDRLENIVHLAQDFEGVDPLEEPMPVKPGAHYTMGGIEINEWGETVIDGLYAAGECGCVSMHGANRLGGNSLAELLVFGARAGRAAAGEDVGTPEIQVGPDPDAEREDPDWPIEPGEISGGPPDVTPNDALVDPVPVINSAVEAETERIDSLLVTEDGVSQAAIRSRVQDAMGEHLNVFREKSGIETALKEIGAAKRELPNLHVTDTSRTFNTELQHALETRNLIDLAEAIAFGALAREESRGAHWRKAHQERKDEEWRKHTMLSWNDGDPEMWYRPNILESEIQEYDPTERSY
ncbi:FAD-binding protein [Halodesulfurarchaeum sp.]|uniref:FAD-binding protein n=1 Tax=Halodesulfurarchaeum sp. TaxID=1980530 RepID=UPI001BBCDD6A|nr:FAD-binding protein [Halodesulfurarchaeum sp.]